MSRLIIVTLVALAAGNAFADAPNLKLTREPPPRHLRMRPRTAATTTPGPAPVATDVPESGAQVNATGEATPLGSLRDLRRPISIRFSLGYVVDGTGLRNNSADPACDLTTSCTLNINQQPVRSSEISRLRAYALGEGDFSSRGVVFPSLSTYLATKFQIAKRTTGFAFADADQLDRKPIGPPVATWFERSGIEPRQFWAEVKDFLPDARLAPLRLRAGEIYVYGPWVLHMYGSIAAWEGKLVKASLYGGSRVPDFTNSGFFDRKNRSGIGGGSLNFDLRALKTPIPFAVGVEALKFTAIGGYDASAANHAALQLDWRPRKDIALISRFRTLDGELANEYVQLRTRYKLVSNLVFDYSHRHSRDWRWDPSITSNDSMTARRYLDLGPNIPQSIISGRAGTLIKENVDVLVRGALAWDGANSDIERNTFMARYFELGTALEVRLRRTVGVGLSALTRQTERTATVTGEIVDIPNQIDPIPIRYSPEMGEIGFTELGTTLRLSLGARRLSALVEAYGRRTRYALDYCAPAIQMDGTYDPRCMSALDTGIQSRDIRGGGRFTLDAWVGSQLRLFASYEISSRIDFQRELSGFKSLRLVMEGNY
ncbi:MAG TPA: hypothetical protein VMZ53_22585 [Kofleriaceae bacterium]|nr:hypothetical protein [Kofleriaceae bacterium]